jgi:hypothetical protein
MTTNGKALADFLAIACNNIDFIFEGDDIMDA